MYSLEWRVVQDLKLCCQLFEALFWVAWRLRRAPKTGGRLIGNLAALWYRIVNVVSEAQGYAKTANLTLIFNFLIEEGM